MTASWMLGSAIATVLFACAAVILEPVVALYRRMPLRWVWAAAISASLAYMAVALVPRRPAPVVIAGPTLPVEAEARGGGTMPGLSHAPRAPVSPVATSLAAMELPPVAPRMERALRIVWAAASALLALFLLAAALRLRKERSEWTHGRVAGTRLLLSNDFGPAIVGVLNPEIVVPRWIAELDEPSRRAIVAHEAEHLRAHDQVLLLAGLVAVVAMPWNAGLWLCWRGLRRTIELDCDARVLAGGVARSEYANVLLRAWQRARSSWLPSPAFAERASGLGKRVEHLMRPEPRRRAMRTLIGIGAAAVLVLVASVTPAAGQRSGAAGPADGPYPLVIIDGVRRPDLPPRYRYTGPVVVETTTAPTFKIAFRGPTAVDPVADKLYPPFETLAQKQEIYAPASVMHFGPEAKYGAVLYYTKQYRAAGGPILFPAEGDHAMPAADPSTPAEVMALRVLDNLFVTIALAPRQRLAALAIIEQSLAEQAAVPRGPVLAVRPLYMKIQDRRDLALRALLASDSDRAKFDVRAAEGRHGTSQSAESVADVMFTNLFVYDSLTLSKESAARAHEIIRGALVEEVALYDRAPGDFDGRLAIRRKRDAELRTLLTSDRDRETFDMRAARTMRGELIPPSKPKTL